MVFGVIARGKLENLRTAHEPQRETTSGVTITATSRTIAWLPSEKSTAADGGVEGD